MTIHSKSWVYVAEINHKISGKNYHIAVFTDISWFNCEFYKLLLQLPIPLKHKLYTVLKIKQDVVPVVSTL